jgi:hypothetical protein
MKLTKSNHDVKIQTVEIRLECLKLAHTHGRGEAEVIGRAKIYEEYLLGQEGKSSDKNSKGEASKAQKS